MVTPALISPPRPTSAKKQPPPLPLQHHVISFEGDEVLPPGELLKYVRLAASSRGPLAGLCEHLVLCKDPHCAHPHCRSSRRVIHHFKRCTDHTCSVCAPTRQARRKGHLLLSLHNAARGRGNNEYTELWRHLKGGCNEGAQCRWPRCVEAKDVLDHVQSCTDALCPVCLPSLRMMNTKDIAAVLDSLDSLPSGLPISEPR